ncbi:MAG: TonB-dependent receptor [Opitutus sp.]|nr:TonB-dependent receptor [Opitutus sp.]
MNYPNQAGSPASPPFGPRNKNLSTFLVRVAAFAALCATAVAQSITGGTIQGRVMNAGNGTYLDKALVVVEGTTLQALTNGFGEYQIPNVPAGKVTLKVTYTGQPSTSVAAVVSAGQISVQDVALGDASNLRADGTVVLNEFRVESERFKNATQIAINEERYSTNIKNVVSADQFGDIPSGNVGEFIKFLPGVELEYGGTYIAPTDAFGISVRGFGAEDTAIYIDGVPVASASQASLTTQVGLDMLSINNASRVELVKVATPDMPMNSVGGQINLISKSAFEYARPALSWRAYVTINSEDPNPFKRVPGPQAKKVFAGQPGFELTYVRPINKKLGVSLTASTFSQFSENRRFRPEWGTASVTNLDLRPFGGAATATLTNALGPAGLANPYLTRVSITDAPRNSRNGTASMKADWKPFNSLALAGSYQISTYKAADAARRIQARTTRPQTWDATSTISLPFLPAGQIVTGQPAFNPANTLDMNIDSRDKQGVTHTGSLRAAYRRGPWEISALASASSSRASFKDLENGHFSTVDVSATIGQIRFEKIADGVPGATSVYDRNGNAFAFTKLANWTVPTIQARSGKAESLDDVFNYKLDVRRELDFLPWKSARLAVKTGFLREETLKKKWGLGTGFQQTYVGPALTPNDYLDTTYLAQNPGFGFAPQEWISTYRLYDVYKANPNNFTVTEANSVNNWNSFVGQNKRMKQTRDAWYAQVEGRALKNRLSFVAGLRDEDTVREGRGPQGDGKWNFLKDADGILYRNVALAGGNGTVRIDQATSALFAQTAAGTALRADLAAKRIIFPTGLVASTSLQAAMLQRHLLQPVGGESKGKPSYSVNLAYNITENLVGKLAWSRSFGRIPIESATLGLLSGNQNDYSINQNEDPTAIPAGVISVANPNLLPEVSDNWDFAVTYYTRRGGKLGASYYVKNVKNFSESITTTSGSSEFNEILGSIGLDPADYRDWQLKTAVNGAGTGKVSGFELEAFQDLRFLSLLGDWGRRVDVFATYSRSHRSENNTTRISARPAASQLATGGINFAANRFSVNLKASWRDRTYKGAVGNFTVNGATVQLGAYDPSSTKVDASLNWQFSKKYSFYVSGRNIFEAGLRVDREDLAGIYPAYAHWDDLREFGVQVTMGIRGSF